MKRGNDRSAEDGLQFRSKMANVHLGDVAIAAELRPPDVTQQFAFIDDSALGEHEPGQDFSFAAGELHRAARAGAHSLQRVEGEAGPGEAPSRKKLGTGGAAPECGQRGRRSLPAS